MDQDTIYIVYITEDDYHGGYNIFGWAETEEDAQAVADQMNEHEQPCKDCGNVTEYKVGTLNRLSLRASE